MGVRATEGGEPQMCATSNFRTPFFPENPSSNFFQKLSGESRYLKRVNLYFGPDLTTGNGEKAYTVCWCFRVWGQNPTRQPGIRPQFL